MQWRFIEFRHYDPHLRLGLNEAVLDHVAGGGAPTISMSGWKPSCINIGYTQDVDKVVDREAAAKHGLIVVRRHTSGGAMVLTEEGEICWGLTAPESMLPPGTAPVYELTSGILIDALGTLGIEANHKPINDVVTTNGKISGAAMRRSRGVVYVSGTLLYRVQRELLLDILKPENDAQKDSLPEKLKRVTSIEEESDATREETIAALRAALLDGKDYLVGDWTAEELRRAEELAKTYSSRSWLEGAELP